MARPKLTRPPSFMSIDEYGPPLSSRDLDQLQYHISLQEIGKRLQDAANAAYPSDHRSRYSAVNVLLLCWEDEDPLLPVSIEIVELQFMFEKVYNFEVEWWKIPSQSSHNELNRKVLDFVAYGGDSPDHLKIVYYGGHGMLAHNRQASWASRPDTNDSSFRTVKWSGIQQALEEAESDVLLLLDCCASGTANGMDEGHGVTELIAACGFNTSANPVGPYSFTRALIIELQLLSQKPCFTVGSLYNKILCRLQNWMPMGREMQKPPLHVVLTQQSRLPRGIQLSPRSATLPESYPEPASRVVSSQSQSSSRIARSLRVGRRQHPYRSTQAPRRSPRLGTANSTAESISSIFSSQESGVSSASSAGSEYDTFPRIAITIRLQETLSRSDLSVDLFSEWLRMMPVIAEKVKVEAGFSSFSTLLTVSLPIEMWCYLSNDAAICVSGFIKSNNLLLAEPETTSAIAGSKENCEDATKIKVSDPHPTVSSLGWNKNTKAFLKLYKFEVTADKNHYLSLLPGLDPTPTLPAKVYLSQHMQAGEYLCQWPLPCYHRAVSGFETLSALSDHYVKEHSSTNLRGVSQRTDWSATQDSAVEIFESSQQGESLCLSSQSNIQYHVASCSQQMMQPSFDSQGTQSTDYDFCESYPGERAHSIHGIE